MIKTKQTPFEFFLEHGGYSYDPATETADDGRKRCATALAQAEQIASERGFSFEWMIDEDCDSSDFSDKKPAWSLWGCILRDEVGEVLGSLWAIDFGSGGEPWDSPYRRVVQAELAIEAID